MSFKIMYVNLLGDGDPTFVGDDVTGYIIDEEIIVNERLEFEDVFQFSSGEMTIRFSDNLPCYNVKAMFVSYPNAIYYCEYDDGQKFAGYFGIDNFSYDMISEIYSIHLVDIGVYVYDYLGKQLTERWQSYWDSFNLKSWLERYIGIAIGKLREVGSTIADIQLPDDSIFISEMEYDLYVVGYNSESGLTVHAPLTQKDFLVECLKHFGAYFFIDGDLTPRFINRNYTYDDIDISDDIIDATYEVSGKLTDYNSILISVEGSFPEGHYAGWALFKNDGTLQTGINADLSNINAKWNYLDLRQYMYYLDDSSNWQLGYDFSYRVFVDKDEEEIYNSFVDILENKLYRKVTVARTDLKKQNGVIINENLYRVWSIERSNYGHSTLELIPI